MGHLPLRTASSVIWSSVSNQECFTFDRSIQHFNLILNAQFDALGKVYKVAMVSRMIKNSVMSANQVLLNA